MRCYPFHTMRQLRQPWTVVLALCVWISGVMVLPLMHQLEHRNTAKSFTHADAHVQAEWNAVVADALQALALSEDSLENANPVTPSPGQDAFNSSSAHSHQHQHHESGEHGEDSLWHFGLSLFQPLVLPQGLLQTIVPTYTCPLSSTWTGSLCELRVQQPRAPPA